MTLTQTAILTKQVITITAIALVLGTLSFITYKVWYAYYLTTLPPVEEKPDTKFGILPQIDFPKSSVSSSNFSYSLDTATGILPKLGSDGFEKIIKVYFIIKPLATLLSPEKTQSLASKFNISSPPQILTETNYQFIDAQKTLNVDLNSGNFTFNNEASISAQEKLEDDNQLVSGFENVLNLLEAFKLDLKDGRFKIIPLKINGNQLTPTQLRSEATAAQISLWRKNLDKKPILTSNYNTSLINAKVINSASKLERYVSLNFTYWQIDENTYATYPTKLPEDALNDLKNGKGIIILEPPKPQISITSIYLGYYLPSIYNQYLQPIYVFEGPGFVAYVSAISSNFTEAK